MILSTPALFIQPILQWRDDVRLWELKEDYCFQYGGRDRNVYRVIVKAGMLYDKASVPRPLWGIARADGPWEGPSLIHDYIWRWCKNGGKFPAGTYQMKVADTWVDKDRMSQWDSNMLLAMMGEGAGESNFECQLYRWAVQLCPVNWGKGF